MIISFLFSVAVAMATPILNAFSWSGGPGAQDLSGFAVIGSALGTANGYLPVGTFLALIVAGFVFDLSLTGAKTLVWLYEHIPFKAT